MARLRVSGDKFRVLLDKHTFKTPHDILNGLDAVVTVMGWHSFGAWLFAPLPSAFSRYVPGQTSFLHESVPDSFRNEWRSLVAKRGPSPLMRMAFHNRGPFTFTECMRSEKITTGTRWVFDLYARHGMRDGIYCPVGVDPLNRHSHAGIWNIVFWSPTVIRLSDNQKRILHGTAVEAAFYLHKLTGPLERRQPQALSARQSDVLDGLAYDMEIDDIATMLKIKPTSVNKHIERAQQKLGVETRAGAVAAAIRLGLLR